MLNVDVLYKLKIPDSFIALSDADVFIWLPVSFVVFLSLRTVRALRTIKFSGRFERSQLDFAEPQVVGFCEKLKM